MANAIKVFSKVEWHRSDVIDKVGLLRTVETSTTSELFVETVQTVGTTHEVIAAGDVTDDAYLFVRNLSSTATVQIGGDSAGSFVEWFFLAPGDPEAFMGRVGTLASTYLKASGASTQIAVRLVKIS